LDFKEIMSSQEWKKGQREEFNLMKEFFNNTCVKCRGTSNLLNVERDHIKPTYQGGKNEPFNWQPLCARCNSGKGSESIDYRIDYCKEHNLIMPKKWIKNPTTKIEQHLQALRQEYPTATPDRKRQIVIVAERIKKSAGLYPVKVEEKNDDFKQSVLDHLM
jgi:hypothetical protein